MLYHKKEKGWQHMAQKKITLTEKLNKIYDSVDLRTECSHSCTCCKVACPSMNFCEFSSLINQIWNNTSNENKLYLICTSIEYFFKNEFEKWGLDTLIKPCMLLDDKNMCKWYDFRPLNCRMYGLWPDESYKARVDKFEKAYEGLLKREDIPLNTQCKNVKRVNEDVKITTEIVEGLFSELDSLDNSMGYSKVQIQQKDNYRTFHDWLLFHTFGEEWLVKLTSFMLSAKKDDIVDLIGKLKTQISINGHIPTLNLEK